MHEVINQFPKQTGNLLQKIMLSLWITKHSEPDQIYVQIAPLLYFYNHFPG